ncbi:MAG: hypothetical protein AAGG72_03500 [Pseudomonadota bacterium]
MAERTARKVEIRKKKLKRRIARPPQSRVQGNTNGVRQSLKKAALRRQGQAAPAAV